jgi:hypothetical protein
MSRQIGDEFEDMLCSSLGINKTTNSGAKFNNGDMSNSDFIIEAKVKNTSPTFKPDKKELTKLKKQAKTRLKEWIYIQRAADGDYVLLELGTFLDLWNKNDK